MNMSEEVTNVTLQVTEKAVTTGLNATTRIAEMFARLFRELMAMSRERNASKAGRGNISGSKEKVKETDLTDLKPGYAAVRDLEKSAQKTGDTIATSEHGMSREDMKAVCHKAKKYGIPVAFKNPKGKDNIYACVRGSDLPIFKQICTEVIQDKIAVAPEKLGKFKCEEGEMPFLTAEMKNLDVAAMCPSSAQGSFCLYEANDEKLIRCAREEFAKKYAALERDVAISKDEQDFYSITDTRTGKSVTFDEIPTRKKLSEQIQAQFGFDENKANMCVAKFAQEMLHGADRERLVSPKAQEEFSNIGSMVELDGEHPLASHYQCWHLKPKDDVSRIVFRDGESGQFAILDPLKMSDKKMRAVLTEQLGITDKDMLHALTDKADRLAQHYEREVAANYMDNHSFHLDDFKPEELVEHKTVGASGQEYVTKLKPIDSVEQTIDRSGRNAYGATDRDAFTLDVKFTASAPSADGKTIETSTSSTTLELSLADKKTGMKILTEMYKEHGIPEATAREMAKSVFKKAEMQSPERVVRLEEVRAETMKVVYGTQSAEVSTADRQSAAQEIADQFGIPVETAQEIVEKAEDAKRAAHDTSQETEAQDAKKTAAAETDAQPDAETDSRGEGERKPTEAKPTPGDDAKPDASQGGNGHEKHRAPTQDALDQAAAGAMPTQGAPGGALPSPDVP